MPLDLVLFGVIVLAFFVIGLPVITRRVSVPRKVEFEDVSEGDLSDAQAGYFADLDGELLEMGYQPVGDRRATNMQGKALVRIYMSSADPAIIMMTFLTSEVQGSGAHPMNYLEIVTRYGDGSILSTRNAEISDVLKPLPGHIIQDQKGCRDPAKLKLAHDTKARELLLYGPVFSQPEEFERVFDEFHERWCLHQMECGLLVPRTEDPQRLRPTVKAGLRGIANFLNPLADNFTVPRFVLVLMMGLAAPAAVLVWLEGPGWWLVARIASAIGVSPTTCTVAAMAVVMTGVGALVGLLFVGKAFIWSFLLTYLVFRLLGPQTMTATVILSLWTGAVSNWAAALRERRQRLA
ncbi:MAG: hypothetical protein QNL88_04135 [Acidobacteriota bacterium]|nr:hypothetical protein [Acidobacteriota bacterium]